MQDVEQTMRDYRREMSDLVERIEALGFEVPLEQHPVSWSPWGPPEHQQRNRSNAFAENEARLLALQRLYNRAVHLKEIDPEAERRILTDGWLWDHETAASIAAARDVAAAGGHWALEYADLRHPDGTPLTEDQVEQEIARREVAEAAQQAAAEDARRARFDDPDFGRDDPPGLPPRDVSFDRLRLNEEVIFDRTVDGGGTLYGGADGATPLMQLERVNRRDGLYRPFAEYRLADAPELGPVIRQFPDGSQKIVRPDLLVGAKTADEVEDRVVYASSIAAAKEHLLIS